MKESANVTFVVRGEAPRCRDCGRRFSSPQQYYRFGLDDEKVVCKRICFRWVRDILGIRHKIPLGS